MKSRTRQPRAFTLIEAIIGVVICSVAVPGLMWSLREAALRQADPVLMSRARWRAAEKIEDILADRHSPSVARGYAYVTTANYAPEASIAGEPGFARQVAITETGPNLISAGTGYKTVVVTVSWVDGSATTRSLSLSTVLTDYTP